MINWNLEELKTRGYKINDRKPQDIEPIWRHSKKFGFPLPNFRGEETIYSGAEHTGNPKLPNITFLPGIINHPYGSLIGSTFGHQHTQYIKKDHRQFQEIYEFATYGGILLRKEKSVKLVLARPGEKVVVGTDENMTLFNFGNTPLITLDYANPQMNSATKDLEKEIGSPIAIWKTDYELTFRINPTYQEREIFEGKRNSIPIRAPKGEEALYAEIKNKKTLFSEAGIEIAFGENLPGWLKEEFAKPLEQLVNERNKDLFNVLQIS